MEVGLVNKRYFEMGLVLLTYSGEWVAGIIGQNRELYYYGLIIIKYLFYYLKVL